MFHVLVHLIARPKDDVEGPRGGVRGVIPTKQTYQRAYGTPSPLDEELKRLRAGDKAKNNSKLGDTADTCLKPYRIVVLGVL